VSGRLFLLAGFIDSFEARAQLEAAREGLGAEVVAKGRFLRVTSADEGDERLAELTERLVELGAEDVSSLTEAELREMAADTGAAEVSLPELLDGDALWLCLAARDQTPAQAVRRFLSGESPAPAPALPTAGPEVVWQSDLKREPGFLYLLDPQGRIVRTRFSDEEEERVEPELVVETGVRAEPGWMYFLDPGLNVCRSKEQSPEGSREAD
jgi:hypothetical protein